MNALAMNALIVEDDPLVSDAIGRALYRSGFQVECVETAAAGLGMLARARYHLAVVDRDLPDISGLDLVAEVRRNGNALPILLVGAHEVPACRSVAQAAGGCGYLAKPFDIQDLITRCRDLAGGPTLPPPRGTPLDAVSDPALDGCHRRILERLSLHAGHIVSYVELAAAAQCPLEEIEARVAELHDKLQPPAHIRRVRGLGYRIA